MRIIRIVHFLTLVAGVLLLSRSGVAQEVRLETFVHPEWKFEIGIPFTWTQKLDDIEPVSLVAFSQPVSKTDPFREHLIVAVESTKGVTRKEFLDETRKKLEEGYPGISFEKTESRMVNKVQMDQWVYSYPLAGQSLKSRAFLMVWNDRGYLLITTARADEYTKWLPLFNRITASFEFQPKPKEKAGP